ncbi:MAG: MFS transporter [Pseudonocardiales bacterium]|nr:MAG: MFS transporter [Pseudonocardiales bacterium]
MPRQGHLLSALAQRGFRRLYAARLLGQFGDGVFQASLAGAVLFNPQRQAHAGDVAAGFAALLVPYSLVGPFAGVLLDRWRRQRVLVVANVLRAGGVLIIGVEILTGLHGQPFYASALVVVSLSRLYLSALSAALPHVIDMGELVTANALSTTSGAIATAVGGAGAIAARGLFGGSDGSYAAIAMTAALPYLLSAALPRGFGREDLGPDDVERSRRETVPEVARGLLAGARHIGQRRLALYALMAIGVHRLSYGVSTVCTLLLYRNYFHDDGFFRAGLAGLGQVVGAVAIGGGLAAVVTPAASRRLGFVRWPALLLCGAGLVEIAFGLPYTLPLLLVAAVLLGFAAQSIKICIDTLVQQHIEDEFRGRVFSLYDSLFNLTLVAAALLTALVLPESGYSPAAVVVIALGYAATGVTYLRLGGRVSAADSPHTSG